jgi:hypothetical protein
MAALPASAAGIGVLPPKLEPFTSSSTENPLSSYIGADSQPSKTGKQLGQGKTETSNIDRSILPRNSERCV